MRSIVCLETCLLLLIRSLSYVLVISLFLFISLFLPPFSPYLHLYQFIYPPLSFSLSIPFYLHLSHLSPFLLIYCMFLICFFFISHFTNHFFFYPFPFSPSHPFLKFSPFPFSFSLSPSFVIHLPLCPVLRNYS